MITSLDLLVATTLGRSVLQPTAASQGPTSGYEFEQSLYHCLEDLHEWHHAAGPDQFDMSLPISSRTGIHYEFDGVFVSADTLYVIEAKHLMSSKVSREHVGVLIAKLLDIACGSNDEIGHLSIRPIVVSALPHVDDAARHYAAAWGVLLLSPGNQAPFEVLSVLRSLPSLNRTTKQLLLECETLANHLWRPFNHIVHSAPGSHNLFELDANQIYDEIRVRQILAQCRDCAESAQSLGLIARSSALP